MNFLKQNGRKCNDNIVTTGTIKIKKLHREKQRPGGKLINFKYI